MIASGRLASSAFGQIKLNHSNLWPAPHKHSVLATEWAKEIEKRTNGRVVNTVRHGGTFTPGDKAYDGVVRGISDAAMSVCGYTRRRFPSTEVIELPLGYKSVDETRRWERAVKPLYDEYVKSMKERGLPGEEALRFCLERLYTIQG